MIKQKLFQITFFALFLACLSLTTQATVKTTTNVNGGLNWSDPAAWVGGVAPIATDSVLIAIGDTIRVVADVTCATLTYAPTAITNTLVYVKKPFKLTVTGRVFFNFPTAGTVKNLLNVDSASLEAGSITMNSSANDIQTVELRISTGTATILGSFDLTTGANINRRIINISSTGSLILNGQALNNGTISLANASIFVYNYAGNYNLFAGNYGNLTLNGGGTRFQPNNGATINGLLTLNGTDFRCSQANLTIGSAGGILFNGGAYIIGFDQKLTMNAGSTLNGTFNATNSIRLTTVTSSFEFHSDALAGFTRVYPIGTNADYLPYTITALTGALIGGVNSRFIKFNYINKPHDLTSGADSALSRFYRIISANITVTSASGSIIYANADVVTPLVEDSLKVVARLSTTPGIGWVVGQAGTSVDVATNSINFNAINAIAGEWTAIANAASVYTPTDVYTVTDGDFDVASTWSSNAVPTAITNVFILHNVGQNANTFCNNLTIGANGRFIMSTKNMTVSGNTVVNGYFGDVHGGGNNIFNGTITINIGGTWNFTGSGGGTNSTFNNTLINNGTFNHIVLGSTITFDRAINPSFAMKGSQPYVFISGGTGAFLSLLDSLILESTYTSGPSIVIPVKIKIGKTNTNADLKIVNKTYVDQTGGSDSIVAGVSSFARVWYQAPGSYLRLSTSRTTLYNGAFVFDTPNNTVDYHAFANQTIANVNHYNIVVTGDRHDRYKTFSGNITVFGNIDVYNNGAILQFGANGQTIAVKGNITLMSGNAQFMVNSSNSWIVNLSVNGIINNGVTINAVKMWETATKYCNLTLTGSTDIINGDGSFILGKTIISNPGADVTANAQRITVNDTITFNAKSFTHSSGRWFLANSSKSAFKGSSQLNVFDTIFCADRNDMYLYAVLYVPITVNHYFYIQSNDYTRGYFDLNGQTLTVNGICTIANTGNSSQLRGTVSSKIYLNGPDTCTIAFAKGYRILGELWVNKVGKGVNMMSKDTIYGGLALVNGKINTSATNNFSFADTAFLARAGGSIKVAPVILPGAKYDLEYHNRNISSSVELVPASIRDLQIDLPSDSTITFNASPIVTRNILYRNGKMTAIAANYIKLATGATLRLENPFDTTNFPIGTATQKFPLDLGLNSIADNYVDLALTNTVHINKPVNVLSYLNFSGTLSGNASSFLGYMKLYYQPANVVGTESNIYGSDYFAGSWHYGDLVNAVNHTLSGEIGMNLDFAGLALPASTNANLSALTISAGALVAAFDSATISYVDTVANAVSTLTVTPISSNSTATIKVNTVAVTSGAASQAITLTANAVTTITTVVKAADGTTTKTYTVAVFRRPSSDNDLSSLTIASGTLVPTFASSTLSYVDTVLYGTTSITVTPTVNESNATITVDGSSVTSGAASSAIALTMGTSNAVTIVVTAQDGSTKTYTVNVYRYDNVSVAEIKSLELFAYPNPVIDVLTIDNAGQYDQLDVTNALGQVIISTNIQSDNAKINFNGLTKGLYFVTLKGISDEKSIRITK